VGGGVRERSESVCVCVFVGESVCVCGKKVGKSCRYVWSIEKHLKAWK